MNTNLDSGQKAACGYISRGVDQFTQPINGVYNLTYRRGSSTTGPRKKTPCCAALSHTHAHARTRTYMHTAVGLDIANNETQMKHKPIKTPRCRKQTAKMIAVVWLLQAAIGRVSMIPGTRAVQKHTQTHAHTHARPHTQYKLSPVVCGKRSPETRPGGYVLRHMELL